jgi:hypothetical protein
VASKIDWRFRLHRTFFGLSNKYIEAVYEEFFLLKYYTSWSLTELYNLPVGLRRWFLKRLAQQKENEKEATEKAQKKQSR